MLDTSAVILLMRLRQAAGPDAVVPFATLAELFTGVYRANDPTKELERVSAAVGSAVTIHSTDQTVRYYGRITAHLQRIGLTIPPNDAWNESLALEHDLPLLSDDAHFRRVPGLRFIPVR